MEAAHVPEAASAASNEVDAEVARAEAGAAPTGERAEPVVDTGAAAAAAAGESAAGNGAAADKAPEDAAGVDSVGSVVPAAFAGIAFNVLQHPGSATTGWRVWNSASTLLRFLEQPGALAAAAGVGGRSPLDVAKAVGAGAGAGVGAAGLDGPSPMEAARMGAGGALRVLDLSAGTGINGMACALVGCAVVATDIAPQMPLLRQNVELCARRGCLRAGGGDGGDSVVEAPAIAACQFAWGEDVSVLPRVGRGGDLAPAGAGAGDPFDLVVCSDSLFISIRDSIQDLLMDAIVGVVNKCIRRPAPRAAPLPEAGAGSVAPDVAAAPDGGAAAADPGGCMLFTFEERLAGREEEWLRELRGQVDVTEVDAASLDTSDARAAEDESGLDSLFYEPPPVRLLVLRPRAERT